MIDYLTYTAAGEITGSGVCADADYPLQANPAEGLYTIEGALDTDPAATIVDVSNPAAPALIARPASQPVPPGPAWRAYQVAAQAALDNSDITMHRIAEAVSLGLNSWTGGDVVAWVDYRRSLRAILSASSGMPGVLPVRPPYPAGT